MRARLRVSDLVRMALAWAISSLALMAADALLPGLDDTSPWQLVAATAVTGLFGVLVRPLLVTVASAIGWVAVGVLAITGQAVVMQLRRWVIYVNSSLDTATLEVSAFEGLVGSHGGLGGSQDRGLFIAPTHLLEAGCPEIRGAEELHHVLVSMLVRLGHRTQLPRPAETAHQ